MRVRRVRSRELEIQLAAAEEKLREQREIMSDLLRVIGNQTVCGKCGNAVYRVVCGDSAMLFNGDGTEHWRCERFATGGAS